MRELVVAMGMLWGARDALVAWRVVCASSHKRVCRSRGLLLTQDIMLANYDLVIVGRHLKVQHASMQCFAMWRQAPFAKSCCFSRQRPERHAAVLTLHGHEIEANDMPYTKCYLGARHLLRYFNEYFSFLGCNRGGYSSAQNHWHETYQTWLLRWDQTKLMGG